MRRSTLRLGACRLEYAGSAQTRLYLVLGHPVAHSLSPVFQAAALRALGLDAVYLAADIEPTDLPQALADLRDAAAVGGANVTLPHKLAVLPAMDTLDEDARVAGAVNTIVCLPAGSPSATCTWRGANTDVDGLRRSLDDAGVGMTGRPVVVLGSGGMARAAVVAALRAGASEVRILARDPARAETLTAAITSAWPGTVPAFVHGDLAAPPARILDDASVLVQATRLGLGATDPSPLGLERAPRDLFVFEAIYEPPATALLRAARARGLRATNGLGMLVHQGARALQLWTGCEPPLEVMRRSVGLA